MIYGKILNSDSVEILKNFDNKSLNNNNIFIHQDIRLEKSIKNFIDRFLQTFKLYIEDLFLFYMILGSFLIDLLKFTQYFKHRKMSSKDLPLSNKILSKVYKTAENLKKEELTQKEKDTIVKKFLKSKGTLEKRLKSSIEKTIGMKMNSDIYIVSKPIDDKLAEIDKCLSKIKNIAIKNSTMNNKNNDSFQ